MTILYSIGDATSTTDSSSGSSTTDETSGYGGTTADGSTEPDDPSIPDSGSSSDTSLIGSEDTGTDDRADPDPTDETVLSETTEQEDPEITADVIYDPLSEIEYGKPYFVITDETVMTAEVITGAAWNQTLPEIAHPDELQIVSVETDLGPAAYFMSFDQTSRTMLIEQGASMDYEIGLYLL